MRSYREAKKLQQDNAWYVYSVGHRGCVTRGEWMISGMTACGLFNELGIVMDEFCVWRELKLYVFPIFPD